MQRYAPPSRAVRRAAERVAASSAATADCFESTGAAPVNRNVCTRLASAAPIGRATMNSHSGERAQSPTKTAGPLLLAG